jgi:hypothetical protein
MLAVLGSVARRAHTASDTDPVAQYEGEHGKPDTRTPQLRGVPEPFGMRLR